MKRQVWKFVFALSLIGFSILFYCFHFLIFKEPQKILDYFLLDIAFVPINVLLVTLVLEHIFESKQKEIMLHKLNMVLGAFFSEVGQPLLNLFKNFNSDNPGLTEHLQLSTDWTQRNFATVKNFLLKFTYVVDIKKADLQGLCQFLSQKRVFCLALLENPNLLEHDKITDMLWAIFHLTEELLARHDLSVLHERDSEHLTGDIKRAYIQLILEWLEYMKYLKNDYPYLYSLAVRTNPFNPNASAEIA